MAFFVRYTNRRRALAANMGHVRVFLGTREAARALEMKVKAGTIALGGSTWGYIPFCMEWAMLSF
jgi:hypothetical protein